MFTILLLMLGALVGYGIREFLPTSPQMTSEELFNVYRSSLITKDEYLKLSGLQKALTKRATTLKEKERVETIPSEMRERIASRQKPVIDSLINKSFVVCEHCFRHRHHLCTGCHCSNLMHVDSSEPKAQCACDGKLVGPQYVHTLDFCRVKDKFESFVSTKE